MKKRGLVWQTLIPWIVAILLITLIFIGYGIITGKLAGIGETIRNALGLR